MNAMTMFVKTWSRRAALAWAAATLPAVAADWPGWRGPASDGVAAGTGYVRDWSRDTNVRWQATLPGLGASTPAVWGDAIVLTLSLIHI